MKVMKFGGSSVADYPQMLNAISIIKNTAGNKIVILSACKSITDKLEQAAILSADKNIETKNDSLIKRDNIIKYILDHHIGILNATLVKHLADAITSVNQIIVELTNILLGISLLNEVTNATKDSILAFGELLSTNVFHFMCKEKGINNSFLDARDLIYTDDNYSEAHPYTTLCCENIIKAYSQISTDLVITQGFIGSFNDYNTPKKIIQKRTTTLGRGGSDYTASIVGAVLGAEEIQIWTDVDGVLSADPRFNDNTFTINKMSFEEIKDLSFWGAKVLHPKTILPAIEKNINIKVLNTFNPTNQGTLITAHYDDKIFSINSVIAKENCILHISEDDNINDNLSLYSGYCNGKYIKLFDKKNIITEYNLDYVSCSVICISGVNFNSNPILFTKFLSTLTCLENIEILQIIFEFSFNSFLLVVGDCDVNKIVKQIHCAIVDLKNNVVL